MTLPLNLWKMARMHSISKPFSEGTQRHPSGLSATAQESQRLGTSPGTHVRMLASEGQLEPRLPTSRQQIPKLLFADGHT